MATLDDIDALLARGDTPKALRLAKMAAQRRSRDPRVLELLARCFAAERQFRKALSTYDKLIALVPDAAKPLADKAHLLQQMGELAPAASLLRKALFLQPLNGSLLRMLALGPRLAPDDPAVAPFVQAWQDGRLPAAEKVHAGYGLFKSLGAEGFAYLDEANRLQRRAHPWSMDGRSREVAGLQAALDAGPWPDAGSGAPGRLPIFVTGMPRSGTTLVEQVLACHPKLTATGETGLTLRAAYSVLVSGGRFRPVRALTGDDLALIGRRYVEGIDHFHGPGPAFTDKSIQTYLVMGLLHHILPQARTIVVRRDPRDIGWSIYRNHFADGTHGYSNSLADIAAMIGSMEDAVAYWRAKRPEAFIELRYEDLVRDPEPEIRRMLDYCGLEWNAACLAPERNAGMVKTLSAEQVRGPISPKSIGGWRAYATELEPLVAALGSRVDEWD